MPYYRRGFTLLEMMIVILIISLIAGGILVGSHLIRAAEIRGALGEYDLYVKAIKDFQDKYQALPGDMSNATSTWGSADGVSPSDAACQTTAGTGMQTCDGDGNGHIGDSTTSAALSNTNEWYRAWQHLANAGLVTGNFTGLNSGGAFPGANVPASQLPGAGWTLNYYLLTTNATDTDLWADQYGHLLNLGGYVAGDYTRGAVLTPAEAYVIDQKIDDGRPGTGKVRAWRQGVLLNCVVSAIVPAQATDGYNTAYTQGNACALVFLTGF